jgi:hypothetical protein
MKKRNRGLCAELRGVSESEREESSCVFQDNTSPRRERQSSEGELSKTPVSNRLASRSGRRGESHAEELSKR